MDEKEHFTRLNSYFTNSKRGYDLLLSGAKHFGFYPIPGKKGFSEKMAQLAMQDLVAQKLSLSEEDHILDAGCGQGVVSVYLAKKYGCRIEAITVVPFETSPAKALAEKEGVYGRVRFHVMDYSNTGVRDNFFDGIFTLETLSHSTDVRKTLSELYRILRKGGRIALFEYTLAEDDRFSRRELAMLKQVCRSSAMDALFDFRHGRFQETISDAGFEEIAYEDITRNTMPSLSRMRSFALAPYYTLAYPFSLQRRFPNLTAAVEIHRMVEKGLVKYNIFTARK